MAALDERLQATLDRLRNGSLGIPEERITALLDEAREEALAEAREILKKLMVSAILERAGAANTQPTGPVQVEPPARVPQSLLAANPLEETPASPQQEAARAGHPDKAQVGPQQEATQAGQPDEAQANLREEVEAIRRKIAENEKLLGEIKTRPPNGACQPPAGGERVQDGAPPQTTPPGEPEDGEGYYVYGISWASGSPEALPEEGIDPAFPVYALSHENVQAILSRVSLEEFGQEKLEAKLNDPAWLEAKVCAHQAIQEAISAGGALIPMKFCTIYLSEARVQEILAQYQDDFRQNLRRLEGKRERGVKVLCNREKLNGWLETCNEKVKSIQSKLAGKPGGAAYFARKQLEAAVAEQSECLGDECAQGSHDRLAACAEEARLTPLQGQEITGQEQRMVLNGAYLVAEEEFDAFRAEMENLEREYSPMGFSYELTGPWPPYHFVTITPEEGGCHE